METFGIIQKQFKDDSGTLLALSTKGCCQKGAEESLLSNIRTKTANNSGSDTGQCLPPFVIFAAKKLNHM